MEQCIDFKVLFDAIPCKAWIVSRSGELLWQNKASRQVTSGKSAWWVSAADSIDFSKPGSTEIRRNGRWIKLTYQPISGPDGVTQAAFSVESDITMERDALPKLLKMKGEIHA